MERQVVGTVVGLKTLPRIQCLFPYDSFRRVNLFVSYFSMYLRRKEYPECKVYCLAQNPWKKVLPRSRNANRKVLNRWNVIADGIARTDRAHRGCTLFLFSFIHFSSLCYSRTRAHLIRWFLLGRERWKTRMKER